MQKKKLFGRKDTMTQKKEGWSKKGEEKGRKLVFVSFPCKNGKMFSKKPQMKDGSCRFHQNIVDILCLNQTFSSNFLSSYRSSWSKRRCWLWLFSCPEQDGGSREAEDRRAVPGLTAKTPPSAAHGMLHLPSAAVCVGVLPGLCAYSGSSDSDSSSDSEGSVDAIMSPYPRHNRAYR